MFALLGLLTAVYGTSLLVATGGTLAWIISPRFRRLLIDDAQRR